MAFKLAEAFVEFRQRGLTGVQRSITGVGASMNSVSRIARGFHAQLLTLGVGVGVGGMLKLAADAETLQVQFEVLLGSADAAKNKIKELKDFAASTPFQLGELGDSTKKLLFYKVSAEEVLPVLRQLGDIAALSGKPIGELATLYGKAKENQRLFMDDVTRLVEAGIPIYEVMTEQTGKTGEALRKLVETGKAGFPLLVDALNKATGAGGKFENGTRKLAQTTAGKFSTAVDNMKESLATMGAEFLPISKDILDWSTEWAQELRDEVKPAVKGVADALRGVGQAAGMASDEMSKFFDGTTGAGVGKLFETFGVIGRNWQDTLTLMELQTEAWVDRVVHAIKTGFDDIQLKESMIEKLGLPEHDSAVGKAVRFMFKQAEHIDPSQLKNAAEDIVRDKAGEKIGDAVPAIGEQLSEFAKRQLSNKREQDKLLAAIEAREDKLKEGSKGDKDKTGQPPPVTPPTTDDGKAAKQKAADILKFEELSRKVQQAGQNPVVEAANKGTEAVKQGNTILGDILNAVSGTVADAKAMTAADVRGGVFTASNFLQGILDKADEAVQNKGISETRREQAKAIFGAELFAQGEAKSRELLATKTGLPDRMKAAWDDRREKARLAEEQTRAMVRGIASGKGGVLGPAELNRIEKQLKTTHDALTKRGIKIDGGMPAVLE